MPAIIFQLKKEVQKSSCNLKSEVYRKHLNRTEIKRSKSVQDCKGAAKNNKLFHD